MLKNLCRYLRPKAVFIDDSANRTTAAFSPREIFASSIRHSKSDLQTVRDGPKSLKKCNQTIFLGARFILVDSYYQILHIKCIT